MALLPDHHRQSKSTFAEKSTNTAKDSGLMARRHRRGRPVHGILLLDKPSGGSSNHALQRAKRLFGASKAGHTGSLDPLATGMLPVCFGEATKLSAFLLDADKGYETTMKLGVTTNSADSDGEVVETRPLPADLNLKKFTDTCQQFIGAQLQVPPMVSAIKIDGQRLYKLAREGKEVERLPRPVTIHELEVLSFSGDTARLGVRCSKGTYIRSLVTDIGESLGCGAHVTALRRRFVSPFDSHSMTTLDELEQIASDKASTAEPEAAWPALDELLLPPDAGLGHLPAVHLNELGESAFAHGNAATCRLAGESCSLPANDGNVQESPVCRVYDTSGRLAGLGELTDAGLVSPRRVLQWG